MNQKTARPPRRALKISLASVGVLLLLGASYVLFADLGRHKHQLESFVSQQLGRQFAIDGALHLKLLPSITLQAEGVRLANAQWGSKPQMIEIGSVVAEVDFWSLVSGPIEIRNLELRNLAASLEKQSDGKANWIFQEPVEEEEDTGNTELPLVIGKAQLQSIRVSYLEPGKPPVLAQLEQMTITPGKNRLLALDGHGNVDEYPIVLKGDAGPMKALVSGRDIRMNMNAAIGRLALDIEGGIGRLDPLDGADLKLKATGEKVEALFKRLDLPVITAGALRVDATLKDAGKRTNFDFDAKVGDLAAHGVISLDGLQLNGSDIRFKASAADAARLAGVFDIHDVPAKPLAIEGHVMPSRKEIKLDGLMASLAGASVRVDGQLQSGRKSQAALRFDLKVDDLSHLRATMPKIGARATGNLAASKAKLEIRDLDAILGESKLSGSFSMVSGDRKIITADLSSPRLDLTPFFPEEPADAPKEQAASTPATKEPKKEFLFSEEPLPVIKLKGTEAQLRFACGDLTVGSKSLKDVDGTVVVDASRVTITTRAKGGLEGMIEGKVTLEPTAENAANVNMKINIDNVRAGLDMKEMQPVDVPPLGVKLDIVTNGGSARQMASNANGQVLLTQGPGKTKGAFLNTFGGDMISQLRTKLNPFKAEDPYTTLDCTVMRADIVNGKVAIKPVLMQTQKVTVAASGNVDLHTEELTLDFDTRPRQGIGISPGMFTNPFIRVDGTLASPRVGVGAKGVASGAVAAATGGLSVVAGGVVDRAKGEADMCGKALQDAKSPTPPAASVTHH